MDTEVCSVLPAVIMTDVVITRWRRGVENRVVEPLRLRLMSVGIAGLVGRLAEPINLPMRKTSQLLNTFLR